MPSERIRKDKDLLFVNQTINDPPPKYYPTLIHRPYGAEPGVCPGICDPGLHDPALDGDRYHPDGIGPCPGHPGPPLRPGRVAPCRFKGDGTAFFSLYLILVHYLNLFEICKKRDDD